MERTLRAQRCCIVTLLLTTAALTAACQNSTNLSDLADESANGYTQRSDSDADGQDISIGSFNMLPLGSGSKNIGRLAAVIDKARYDIFAAQEIMNPDGAQELLQALRGATGHDWRMVLSASAIVSPLRTATEDNRYPQTFRRSNRMPDKTASGTIRERSNA